MTDTTIGRCRNCKHWGDEQNALYPNVKTRKCAAIAGEGKPGMAATWGDYGYDSGLDTGPDFGCVLFEAKEAG